MADILAVLSHGERFKNISLREPGDRSHGGRMRERRVCVCVAETRQREARSCHLDSSPSVRLLHFSWIVR